MRAGVVVSCAHTVCFVSVFTDETVYWFAGVFTV